jgi:hypothetical protein
MQQKGPAVVEAASAAVDKGHMENVATHDDPTANAKAQRSGTADYSGSNTARHGPSITPVRLTQ